MLDFVNHYYEVTEENIDVLRKLIVDEEIRNISGHKLSPLLDMYVKVGYVLGNTRTDNPKQTSAWFSKRRFSASRLEKVTTQLPTTVMTIE